jgi:hypothetical protein
MRNQIGQPMMSVFKLRGGVMQPKLWALLFQEHLHSWGLTTQQKEMRITSSKEFQTSNFYFYFYFLGKIFIVMTMF